MAQVDQSSLTSFQKAQRKLASEIEQLERENISKKHWSLLGEINARQREQNSLLGHFVEFDSNAKPVLDVTPEVTSDIENIIKKRITNSIWDDPILDKKDIPKGIPLPENLSTEKSSLSLSQLYENDYIAKENPRKPFSSSLSPEIVSLWDQVRHALDSLSGYQTASHVESFSTIDSNSKILAFPSVNIEKGVSIHAASLASSNASQQSLEEIKPRLKTPIKSVLERDPSKTEHNRIKRKLRKKRSILQNDTLETLSKQKNVKIDPSALKKKKKK